MTKAEFLIKARNEAKLVNHPFPEYAACEAALESGYGASLLARQDNNLFGMKQHRHAIYGTHNLPTREFVGLEKDTEDGKQDGWIITQGPFISYPDWGACFSDRLATLLRLASTYPHYAAAINAKNGETFVKEVSASWSTDPSRAAKVLAVYEANKSLFGA